jgi:hypothetical protein
MNCAREHPACFAHEHEPFPALFSAWYPLLSVGHLLLRTNLHNISSGCPPQLNQISRRVGSKLASIRVSMLAEVYILTVPSPLAADDTRAYGLGHTTKIANTGEWRANWCRMYRLEGDWVVYSYHASHMYVIAKLVE